MSINYISNIEQNKFSKSRPEGVIPNKIILTYSVTKDIHSTITTLYNGGASVHYTIRQDGHQDQYHSEDQMAFYAGISSWKGETSLNNNSIGIMLINDAVSEFPEVQINKLIECIKDINARYGYEMEVLGLGEVAFKHIAPGSLFPWSKLAEAGIGRYFDTSAMNKDCKYSKGDTGPEVEKFQQGLKGHGYNIEVTGVYDEITAKTINVFGSRYGVENDCWSERSEYVINALNNEVISIDFRNYDPPILIAPDFVEMA